MIKTRPVRWENIKIKRISPHVYPRYYRRQKGFVKTDTEHQFLIDEEHGSCEVFYEKIDNGFWLLAIELKVKGNNRYILEAKKRVSNYFSINIFSNTGRTGYRDHQDLIWADHQVVFSNPGTISEIYVEKGSILKCCRLIYTDTYLNGLSNSNDTFSVGKPLADGEISTTQLFRIPSKAEIFLQHRLFNLLRHERKKHYYKSSVFSILFELTAFFLNSLYVKTLPPMFQ